MLEEMFDRRPETGSCPYVTKTASKLTKVAKQNRCIQGSTKRTADESSRGFWTHIDGLIHRCDFGDRDTVVNCF